MSSLIHATITVSGDESQFDACDARIRLLLADQDIDGEIGEHHGAGALCYDMKVKEGIPFPAFAQASQEFPDLKMVAEWVNIDAGERGAATLVAGKLTAHDSQNLATAAGSSRSVHVAVAADGKVDLALTFFRLNREEWLGYALTADRDALLRVVRAPESDAVELYATEGGGEWCLRWRASLAHTDLDFEILDEPQQIDEALYRELEQMAREFAAEWMWFESGAQEEIAIEKERYMRAGLAVHAANVKASRLHQMTAGSARPDGTRQLSTLSGEDAWVRDVVARTWLGPVSGER